MLIYKKRKGKTSELRDSSEWIYAVSNHEGIIDSETWLKAQKLAKINRVRAPNMGCSNRALLSGMIRCAKCGTFMRVAYGNPTKKSPTRKHYYACTLKHNSGGARCDNKNTDGPELDRLIINKLKEMSIDKSSLVKKLKEYKSSLESSSENILYTSLQKSIAQNKEQIDNIINNISLTKDAMVVKVLLDKLATLKDEESKLNKNLADLNSEMEQQDALIANCDDIISKLKNFSNLIDSLNIEGQKKLVSSIIDKVFVNGDTGAVKIKFKNL
ncbi:hypothetical protein SDC9_128456 [bioreactor metagenome]|uniref:Recombinase zinc beta ribbon domain-containing protein n=1 Tax=bioreactor metagenome TaxID=1076179 RepID=A0A645CX01_9ZZZZ